MLPLVMEGFRARAGEVLGQRYRLLRQLGEGGMGEVWEATHLGLNRPVALKILKPRFAQQGEVLLRFRREAQVTAGLGHPKIVEVLDFVWGPGQPAYLVMERLEGRSLETALAERGRLAWPVASRVAVDVLEALGAAHAAGIVHRDIKPANIWLEGDLNEPRVKVLDFGVAQIADASGPKLTKTNTTVGTPQYLPPEQIAGSRVDGRADLWAVGATLYETLAGRPAFIGGDFAALVGAILTSEPPRLEALMPEVPAALAHTIHAALAKKAEDRPQSAEAMAAPLRELLDGLARVHGEDAFAATMTLDGPGAAAAPSALGFATAATPPAAQSARAVPAIDSSPRLPQTRVQPGASQPPFQAPAKKRKFGQAVILNAGQQGAPAQAPAPLSLHDDEPVVLPQRAAGKWLLAGLGFALLGGLVLLGVAILGRQPATNAPTAQAEASTPAPVVSPPPAVGASPVVVADAGAVAPEPSIRALLPQGEPTGDPADPTQGELGAHPTPRAERGSTSPVPGGHAPSASAAAVPAAAVPETPPSSAMSEPPATPSTMAAVAADMSPAANTVAAAPEPPPSTMAAAAEHPAVAPSTSAHAATHLQRGAIGGSYDSFAAEVHIQAAEAAANRCVARMHPSVGTGRYRVAVPADGDVRAVTGGDATVRHCLERAFRIIRWSPPQGGVSQFVTVTYEARP